MDAGQYLPNMIAGHNVGEANAGMSLPFCRSQALCTILGSFSIYSDLSKHPFTSLDPASSGDTDHATQRPMGRGRGMSRFHFTGQFFRITDHGMYVRTPSLSGASSRTRSFTPKPSRGTQTSKTQCTPLSMVSTSQTVGSIT